MSFSAAKIYKKVKPFTNFSMNKEFLSMKWGIFSMRGWGIKLFVSAQLLVLQKRFI